MTPLALAGGIKLELLRRAGKEAPGSLVFGAL